MQQKKQKLFYIYLTSNKYHLKIIEILIILNDNNNNTLLIYTIQYTLHKCISKRYQLR